MTKYRNNRNICLYCFGELNPQTRICNECGRKAEDTPNLPHQLTKRTLLFKRYLISHAIGEGGFGITYLAWDVKTGTKVAVKEFYPSGFATRTRSGAVIISNKSNYAASNRGLKRFIDEAKNLSKLNNLSGIVSVQNFFSENSTAYIVMEFLDGISLKNYVLRKGKISTDTAMTILKPVILSLQAVHETGLIHRDISPDNIIITKQNEVKLIDFGAAKQSNFEGQQISIVLKQNFAPEEQYRLHGEQGPWTDIYALGVTIYYCITGQLPPESIQRMYEDKIIPPSKLGASITPWQEKCLLKALAVFKKDRYQKMADFEVDFYSDESNLPANYTSTRMTREFKPLSKRFIRPHNNLKFKPRLPQKDGEPEIIQISFMDLYNKSCDEQNVDLTKTPTNKIISKESEFAVSLDKNNVTNNNFIAEKKEKDFSEQDSESILNNRSRLLSEKLNHPQKNTAEGESKKHIFKKRDTSFPHKTIQLKKNKVSYKEETLEIKPSSSPSPAKKDNNLTEKFIIRTQKTEKRNSKILSTINSYKNERG